MDYQGLVKRLQLPEDFTPPRELSYQDVGAHALTRADVRDDTAGINASIELIRRTRGGRWPTEPVTEEFNYVDAVWHECEFRDGSSFTYVVHDADRRYLGCAYFYPLGGRTPLSADLLRHDVDVSWWITPDGYQRGYYPKVHDALRHWTTTAFPFTNPYYSNAEIPHR
jgi:RimJ/RimL family protein N-acetyltransferase